MIWFGYAAGALVGLVIVTTVAVFTKATVGNAVGGYLMMASGVVIFAWALTRP